MKFKLGYTGNDASVLFHVFTAMTFLTTLFGGILSDVWLGKFNTIFYLSLFYLVGSIIISIGAIPVIDLSANGTLIVGLIMIALGAGGLKPCVSAFGADQFKMPEQAHHMSTYFSLFYFTISCGPLFSTSLIPVLRENVHCFGDTDCYSLAFGVPAILMIISIGNISLQSRMKCNVSFLTQILIFVVFFVSGKSSYTHVQISSENMLIRIVKCIKVRHRVKEVSFQVNFFFKFPFLACTYL